MKKSLVLATALAFFASGAWAARYPMEPVNMVFPHLDVSRQVFTGFTPMVPRTADVGATIAEIRIKGAYTAATGQLEMLDHCRVVMEFSKFLGKFMGDREPIPTGLATGVWRVATPEPLYLVRLGNPSSTMGHAVQDFIAVRPDGSIEDKLWASADMQAAQPAWGTIKIEPEGCHYQVNTSAKAAPVQKTDELVSSIQYMGRNQIGLLQFGTTRPGGDTVVDVTTPAEPGTYMVHGLAVRVLSASRYKLTYEIESGH
jgi:hypothetical protein